jgi:hypothetical protein
MTKVEKITDWRFVEEGIASLICDLKSEMSFHDGDILGRILCRRDGFYALLENKAKKNITIGPLKRAFAQDQSEVTRAAALDGIFAVSHAEAKPYVEAAFGDRSQLVQRRAHDLWSLYQWQNK